MPRRPADDWFDRLPADRCLAEFSLWSADLCNLGNEIDRIASHADVLHVDVSDGVFAPTLLFFPDLVRAIRARTDLPVHVHLMVNDGVLLSQVAQFADSGADMISVHAENRQASDAVRTIRSMGLIAGAVLRVETPLATVQPILAGLNIVTLLGTEIGVKGQGLSDNAPSRISEMRRIVDAHGNDRRLIAADGGIRENTVPTLVAAGAQTVVMGSLAFGSTDLPSRIDWLRGLGGR